LTLQPILAQQLGAIFRATGVDSHALPAHGRPLVGDGTTGPTGQASQGRPARRAALPDRSFFEALLYLTRTGIPWRDLPAEFGRWDAVYNRFRRWISSGALRRLFEALTADPAFGDLRRVLIDTTTIRAHQHAAGARRKKKRSGQGGRRGSRRWAAAAAV
jgi:transposase